MTKKELKNIFNNLSKKAKRNYKYKRCIQITKKTVLFEVVNLENNIWNNFYTFKLLSHNIDKNISTYSGEIYDINLTKKYNL